MGRLASILERSCSDHAARTALVVPSLDRSSTYSELQHGARRWAAMPGIERRTIVAYMAKSPEFYELSLGAYLFGWAWCPVDTTNPLARLRTIADQFNDAVLVVDDDGAAAELAAAGYEVWRPEQRPATVDDTREFPRGRERYYIATSGTTGRPKLVEVAHDATVPFVEWAIPYYEVDTETRWSQFSSIGFDLSIVDQLVVWGAGGTLVAVATMAERARLHRFANEHQLTHWHSVPSMVPNLVRGGALPHLRVASFCGEPLLQATCQSLRSAAPTARIVNTYGPTEGPLFCTQHEVSAHDLSRTDLPTMPIGEPIPGYSLHLTETPGVHGQRVLIAAPQLAEGYYGVDDPAFGTMEHDGATLRTFDTGDYVVRIGEHLCFSHRADGQVKVAGVRVELGEVSNACALAGLVQPTVLLHDGHLVVFHEGLANSAGPLDDAQHGKLVAALRATLPQVAVPAHFHFVVTSPRTSSGKVDRAALIAGLGAQAATGRE
jgi:non-ribosomal peptide synthetase component F